MSYVGTGQNLDRPADTQCLLQSLRRFSGGAPFGRDLQGGSNLVTLDLTN